MIALSNGKKLIMFKKYTYKNKGLSSNSYRWNCTKSDCKSYLLVSANLDIEKVVERHDHEPPKYKRISKGTYVETK